MPATQLRQNVLRKARRIVVKLGTQLLSRADPARGLDVAFLRSIAGQIAALQQRQFAVTLVSSGAIGAGCAELGLARRPRDVADLQAVAAVGQRRLMTHLHDAFDRHGLKVAQLLLTRSDFDDRVRFLNIRNCVTHLQRLRCVPVLNENDTVAVDEIRFGDNDLLAAMMCNALRADALVLLTVVDGLLDEQGRVIDCVAAPPAAGGLARLASTPLGSGGITTKLEAARLVTEAGEIAVVAHGREPDVLLRLFDGERLGTVFVPAPRKLDSRRRWIGLTKRAAGSLTIDVGAAVALARGGKSLLASGIVAVSGHFQRGEVVVVRDPGGDDLARGLCNYSAEEVRLIMGRRSNQFEKILGRRSYAEVVHRDNLVLTRRV